MFAFFELEREWEQERSGKPASATDAFAKFFEGQTSETGQG